MQVQKVSSLWEILTLNLEVVQSLVFTSQCLCAFRCVSSFLVYDLLYSFLQFISKLKAWLDIKMSVKANVSNK